MKKIITLSVVAFLSTTLYANTDLEAQIAELTSKVEKLEKKQAKNTKKIGRVNALAAKDNIKFDVDFRTSVDVINYETISGTKYENDSLFANRLWLGMGYAPTDNMLFRGQLSFNKAFGAAAPTSTGTPQRGYGYDAFDWVINENLTDDTIKLREAYWLYTDTFGDVGITASVGRRPATNGHLANFREDDKREKSPNAHVINMEFDGASASVKYDSLLPGFMFKLCIGRGLTNANARFTNTPDGASIDYATDDANAVENVDMAGFIFIPYDDGQYSLKTTWYRGFNVPGMMATGAFELTMGGVGTNMWMPNGYAFESTGGDMDGAAISFKTEGIGDGISDFLDETTIFASFAQSKTNPDGRAILGSTDSQTGTSYWIGAQTPNLTGGKFGLEFNHGSKYWRPFTYGEDTMIGSKLATRGNAIEAYWTQPLIEKNGADVFSMQIRYTSIKYDYTGSNAFFGDGATPMSMADAQALNGLLSLAENGGIGYDPVETAQDIRVYFRYRY